MSIGDLPRNCLTWSFRLYRRRFRGLAFIAFGCVSVHPLLSGLNFLPNFQLGVMQNVLCDFFLQPPLLQLLQINLVTIANKSESFLSFSKFLYLVRSLMDQTIHSSIISCLVCVLECRLLLNRGFELVWNRLDDSALLLNWLPLLRWWLPKI